MNREIKFRAWDSDDNEIYEPLVMAVVDNASLSLSPLRNCKDGNRAYKPHHPIMQFTGLTDKNGKEIYEGDILEDSNGNKAVILWDSGDARFINVDLEEYKEFPDSRFNSEKFHYIWVENEVTGNIHENAELLKQFENK